MSTPPTLLQTMALLYLLPLPVAVCQQHSYRTYQGITCLIQISTRSEDFVVDSLVLREHMHLLNESFTDPNIIKVCLNCQSVYHPLLPPLGHTVSVLVLCTIIMVHNSTSSPYRSVDWIRL